MLRVKWMCLRKAIEISQNVFGLELLISHESVKREDKCNARQFYPERCLRKMSTVIPRGVSSSRSNTDPSDVTSMSSWNRQLILGCMNSRHPGGHLTQSLHAACFCCTFLQWGNRVRHVTVWPGNPGKILDGILKFKHTYFLHLKDLFWNWQFIWYMHTGIIFNVCPALLGNCSKPLIMLLGRGSFLGPSIFPNLSIVSTWLWFSC